MKQLILLISLVFSLFAETEFTDPKPSIVEPRQIIFSLKYGDEKSINHLLSTANNVLKYYGPEKVEMEILMYADGLKALLKKDKKVQARIETLMQYDVEFVACKNTMRTQKIKESDLIEGTQFVTAGIVELIEKVKSNWVHIQP